MKYTPSLSPLDGRYASRVADLTPICSEFGLMRYRTQVECLWLLHLDEHSICPPLDAQTKQNLQQLPAAFDETHYAQIKQIEATTNHDVKAVEYFLREHVNVSHHAWIHFACTSEDINNTSYGLMLRDARVVVLDRLQVILDDLGAKAHDWKDAPLLSLTHGQTATPSTLGKEFAVFAYRLRSTIAQIESVPLTAKINGATGTFGAHVAAVPGADWDMISEAFIMQKLGLVHNPLTTQIEPHDHAARLLFGLSEASAILIDLSRDVWGYVSRGVFGQRVVAGEVGSSTMPHKVNPIDFENAEGNLKLSRGIGITLATELPISRWQRDLTDSTLQRNYGLVFGHFVLACASLKKGLGKLLPRDEKMLQELQNAPEVLTEAVQTALRAHGAADAYEQLKNFSRGAALTLEGVRAFIEQSTLPDTEKTRLAAMTPESYVGLSAQLVTKYL